MPRITIVSVIAMVLLPISAFGQDGGEDGERAATPSPKVYAAPKEDESWKQDVLVALIGAGDTGPYFDFGWQLFIRPLGQRSPRAAMRAMVLQVDGGAGISLTVEPVGTGISLNTNTWRMVGQLGYLYPIDRWQVGGLVGVGGDVFNIDLNSVIPSSRIVYVRLGPAGSVDVVNDYLTIRADFGLRFPFHLGELANTFGADSRAFGLDSTVTFQGRIKAGFTYAFRFIWEYFTYRFAGPTDNVPAMGDGGDGNDHAIDFQLLVGWSL